MDRVEQLKDNSILVIDYKTGNVDDQSVQMPLYLNYLSKAYPGQKVNAAYYMLKSQALNLYISNKEKHPIDQMLEAFRQELNSTMAEIFNQEIPFIDCGDAIK